MKKCTTADMRTYLSLCRECVKRAKTCDVDYELWLCRREAARSLVEPSVLEAFDNAVSELATYGEDLPAEALEEAAASIANALNAFAIKE